MSYLILDKKKKLNILNNYFREYWLEFYFHKIISFDLLLKLSNLNLFNLFKLIKSHKLKFNFKFDIKQKSLKESNDSLLILSQLTNQKFLVQNLMDNQILVKFDLLNWNYYKFLNFYCFFIFPFLFKIKKNSDKLKKLSFFFYIMDFHLLINSKYDFFENILLNLQYIFNINDQFNLQDSLYRLYLSSLKLI